MAHFDDLVIELTRRCNMQCDHCCRGDAQALDISRETIDNLLKHVDYIGTLTLTGGEPTLVPELIDLIRVKLHNRGIGVDRFYIATNAKKVSDEFILAVMKLWMYCDEKDTDYGSMLQISNDGHHEYPVNDEQIRKLKAFAFTSYKNGKEGHGVRYDTGYMSGVIPEGNAVDYGLNCRNYDCCTFDDDDYDDYYDDEYVRGDATFYVSANGNVVGDCNLSYKRIDYIKVDNVNDADFTPERAVKRWNTMVTSGYGRNPDDLEQYVDENGNTYNIN